MNATKPFEALERKKPVPTRFERLERDYIKEAVEATGLTASEIIRRSVRLLNRQKTLAGSYGFIIDLNRE